MGVGRDLEGTQVRAVSCEEKQGASWNTVHVGVIAQGRTW